MEKELIIQEQKQQEKKQADEEQARIEFYNSLEQIEKTEQSDILLKHFYILRQYVLMVANGNSNGLIVEGSCGLGKSFNIIKALKDSKKEFVYCSGFSSTLDFYHFLYENKDKIIFFDDMKNIFKSEASLELLKAGLYSPTDKRIIRYNSTTPKLRVPKEFIFEGSIIVALNELNNKQNEDLKAVIDRVLYLQIRFSYEEKIKVIKELVKQDYKELTQEQRDYVFKYLQTNTNEATQNLNFRLLYKLYEIYRYNSEEFPKLAKEIIQTNRHQELILTLLKKEDSMREVELKFCEQTGLSRSQFYRIKAKVY